MTSKPIRNARSAADPPSLDELISSEELDARVQAGELTNEQAAELLQQAARRDTAEHGPTLDTDEEGLITRGGFGSGQGMAKQQTGQHPTKRG